MPASRSPKQNDILAALPPRDYERLLPRLELVDLPRGLIIHGARDRHAYLHFIASGVVSRVYVTSNGESAEFAITGNEGVVGIASFLGGETMPSEAVVLSAGHAYRLRLSVLTDEIEHHSALLRLLLHHTYELVEQTGQIAACNRHHRLEQRLCRWILSSLDRLHSSELAVTQESIALMLGVRREGVTEAAGKLQHAGLIRCDRGRIQVSDRARLEARACECYSLIKRTRGPSLPRYRSAGLVA